MASLGIIGAGTMGRALAARLGGAGHDVALADRGAGKAAAIAADVPSVSAVEVDAALGADSVILAVWHHDCLAIAGEHSAKLAGKIVVDIANPLDETYVGLTVPSSISAAELLADALPDSRIVKAFNTTPAAVLAAGELSAVPLDVFVAADDQTAKAEVMSWVKGVGLRPLDAGTLANARVLERLLAFGIELGMRYGIGFDFAFKFLPTGELSGKPGG